MTNEQNPFTEREYWYLVFPKWVVDWVVAPFSDEVGHELVVLKHFVTALVLFMVFDAVVPEAYDRYGAQGLLLSGLLMLAYGVLGPWE